MPVIAVINRKGGSGKSTVATHVAASFARAGHAVMLGDFDRQQSSRTWLHRRSRLDPVQAPPILGWVVDPASVARPPAGVSHLVLDTPGGLTGFELARLVMWCHAIVIPVCDSAFDRDSAAGCYAELSMLPRVASGRCPVAVVGTRIDRRTRGHAALQAWCAQHQMRFLGSLRYSQVYVSCADRGMTVFDLPPQNVAADLEQWAPVLAWAQEVMASAPLQRTEEPASSVGSAARLPARRAAASAGVSLTGDTPISQVALPGVVGPGFLGTLRRLLGA